MYQQTVNNDNVIVVQTGLFQQDLLASLPFQKTHAISLSPHQIQLLCYCWKCNQSYSCFPNIVLIISLTAVLDAGFERHGNHLIFFLNMEKKKNLWFLAFCDLGEQTKDWNGKRCDQFWRIHHAGNPNSGSCGELTGNRDPANPFGYRGYCGLLA